MNLHTKTKHDTEQPKTVAQYIKPPKQEKDPFILYYIWWPLCNFAEAVKLHIIVKPWRRISGAWYCDHCKTYHCRRVHQFNVPVFGYRIKYHTVCSLGCDNQQ